VRYHFGFPVFVFKKVRGNINSPHIIDSFRWPIPEINFLPDSEPTCHLRCPAMRRIPEDVAATSSDLGSFCWFAEGTASVECQPRMRERLVKPKAFLKVRDGQQAAAEFQKIIDHRVIVTNDIVGVLAHLQLGRAYAMAGDTAKAKAAYQDFLTLWKDADPNIPILKQAKTEYAKLQ
jgi:hypothetical protein